MDYLPLKYHLSPDHSVQRSLFVRVYELVEDEDKMGRVLEVLNIPFFVDEDNLKNLIKNDNDVVIKFVNSKLTDKLKTKTALIEFGTKKDLKAELRLIKHADDNETVYMFKGKVSNLEFDLCSS